MISFPNIDLNLLKLFASLYQTGSVTLTAQELSLSQSACSHALQRLRERLGDELFIRIDNRMHPTEYSHRLFSLILPGLSMLSKGLEESHPFSPDEPHTFKIAATDYTCLSIQPFISYLTHRFNSIKVEFLQLEERLPESELKSANLDLVCGYAHQHEFSESVAYMAWLEDCYVNVRCHSHPIQKVLDLEAFLNFQHILVAPWNERRGIVDISLAKSKKKRQISIKTASILAAPYFVQNTPYLLTVPKLYAERIKDNLSLKVSPLPLKVPNYQLTLYWHKTRHNDPKIEWFIQSFSEYQNLC
ncbi:LysR family transcriptional regulator [Dongshaea marina]|uniref:LysR family transcriptional regulator n=1 Tax=Dongshaea marina TaxID=2047966 RepID=UPI000D3ED01A|nr:LysR family transcriptional regulator [Dongshaea marina]